MKGYYVGFLTGSLVAPGIILNVGHLRGFAALASLASTSVLIHTLLVNPILWFLMCAVTGFAYAGLYVVAETWLNDRPLTSPRKADFVLYDCDVCRSCLRAAVAERCQPNRRPENLELVGNYWRDLHLERQYESIPVRLLEYRARTTISA